MGQGRRWLAAALLFVFAFAAKAAELPDAPSSRAMLPVPAASRSELLAAAVDPIQPVLPVLAPAKAPRKVFDRKFALLIGLSTALTVADYEMTQSCMARHACVESDPFLPHSRAGMYATNIPVNAALFWWSYKRKADGKRFWWLPPLAIIGSHAAGVATNLRFLP